MPVDPQLRSLDIEIPTQPEVLVKLSLLMAEEDIDLQAVSSLVETDMALAAAVMKAVNSSLYGLRGRVQTVHQALTYLGMREVAAITFEMGLRAAFPPAAELEPIWSRAAKRGLLMGRMGQMLGVDPWAAHSAGLFEECGKAVLYRHAPGHYPAMLRAAGTDVELAQLESTAFGVSHDKLGAALCESWGLAPAAVSSVSHHVEIQRDLRMPDTMQRRGVGAISLVAWTLMNDPTQLDENIMFIAPQAQLDETLVLRAARKVEEQLQQAEAQGR
ncbi:HDOD domain-containing protein [Roseateles sp. SL47]|jgi:HD-like signal output (HDOD) protein|uniref:HDOD domain-containing protein n=1 Tax=Roseateles sp. SL47 TaxID=2995138 RepID=UPI002270B60E|nr:HDOD domain-containing protein [Roseateles sp. SL47]WAC74187.1 HDOD domain-containing protein [Roseateles sp. SL47]